MGEFVRARDMSRAELRRRLRAGDLEQVGRGVYSTTPAAATMAWADHEAGAFGPAPPGEGLGALAGGQRETFDEGPAGVGAASGRARAGLLSSLAAHLQHGAWSWRRDLERHCVQWGPGVVVARSAAAALWDLDGFEPPVPIGANVPRSSGIRHPAVRRVAPLEPIVTRHGFDVTGVAQTLIELGAGLAARPGAINDRARLRPDELLELATESALHQGLVTEPDLLDVLAGCGNRRAGAAVLQAVLERRPFGAPPTESYLETRGLQVLRNGGVAPGQRQVEIRDRRGRYIKRVDLLLDGWLIIEFDGEAYHDPERDRELRSAFTAAGYLVLPFDFEQVTRFPKLVVQRVTDTCCGPFR